MRFEGKVVVVTGAAEGIGQAALLHVAETDAAPSEAEEVAPAGQVVTDRRLGRHVDRVVEREQPDRGSHADALGECGGLADEQLGAGRVSGRLRPMCSLIHASWKPRRSAVTTSKRSSS